jgi:hypothetical protein
MTLDLYAPFLTTPGAPPLRPLGLFAPPLPEEGPEPRAGARSTAPRYGWAARLTVAQILAWADEHRMRTGAWPLLRCGPITGTAGETWAAVDAALRQGHRGLPGGDSLVQLLRRERQAPERRGRPRHDARRVLAADLRARGLTLAEVGRRLGVSRQAAWQLLQAVSAPTC